ncbi:hypothetical protein [Mesorhizobium sp. LjRoot246]|uniref:hypothetical protein n=1 Tax=Mesorhizobium sp. LjRoot246 TaxID=3342294 RepID=UPI003ECE1E62
MHFVAARSTQWLQETRDIHEVQYEISGEENERLKLRLGERLKEIRHAGKTFVEAAKEADILVERDPFG